MAQSGSQLKRRKSDAEIASADRDRILALEIRVKSLEELMKTMVSQAMNSSVPQAAGKSENLVLGRLTAKQHIVLQMLLHGATNIEIAARMGISESTAKTHVRGLARRYKCDTRSMLCLRAHPEFEQISDGAYQAAAFGVPKDWGDTYLSKPWETDPFSSLYRLADEVQSSTKQTANKKGADNKKKSKE